MPAIFEIQLIAIIVAVACALPGVFLVLRGTAMMADAITHTVLLGIVIAYGFVLDLNSPWLMVGATLIGVLTVWAVEALTNTRLLGKDSAIGITFPFFFSIAIILISRYASDTHLDVDSVLVGEIAFAPFNRLIIGNYDFGPKSLWVMGIILIINILFITFFYKELKLSTFDSAFAKALGFMPTLLHYALMTLVSLTAVGAYDSVGSILVVGFMVGSPATAYLMTNRLNRMIWLSILIAFFNAIVGVQVAFTLDVTISGMIATVTGITFIIVFIVTRLKKYMPKKVL